MNVVFRTDASQVIGTGHVMRCLTLASALRECNAAVSFLCREHDGHLCDMIEERGIAVGRLPVPRVGNQAEATPTHAAWLGAAWREDAGQTRAAIAALGAKPEWLVVDHYAIDQRWETEMRQSVGRIMVIDDLADREHDCDLLLDQNLVGQMHIRYAGKVPAACGMLLGPEYALLQPIYADLHGRVTPRDGPIRRIFIFFGGADSDNLTGRAISAFLQLDRSDIDADVVISANSPHAEVIRQRVAGYNNIHLHSGLPTLAPLMADADLAIGAGGATSWERLCLGLHALVVTLAENQRPIAEALSQHDLIRWLGNKDDASEGAIEQAMGTLIEQGLKEDFALRCLAMVDGKGTDRVCAALTTTAATPLCVRHAKLEDEALLLAWANDPVTRCNGFSPEPIAAESHRIWFRGRMGNSDGCRLYIVETMEGVALGQVRFERQDRNWEVHYALAQAFRGRGIGRPLLEAAIMKFRAEADEAVIYGQVKANNRPSRMIFESLGFEVQHSAVSGVVAYRRAL